MPTMINFFLKAERQSKILSNSLNLPLEVAKNTLASGVYCERNFKGLIASLHEHEHALKTNMLINQQWRKFILIGEGLDDDALIIDLQKSVEYMANRIKDLITISVSDSKLISILFKLFGLNDESLFIVKSDISLKWSPYFQSLKNEQNILFTDVEIDEVHFRLIAVRYCLQQFDLTSLKRKLNEALEQVEIESEYSKLESQFIERMRVWYLQSLGYLTERLTYSKEEEPQAFNINGKEYLIYGFNLSNSILDKIDYKMPQVNLTVRDSYERQVFILMLDGQKLTFEAQKMKESNVLGVTNYCDFTNGIKETLLSHADARTGPSILHYSGFTLLVRPFVENDLINNSI
tara:strand:+ start:2523 stop:3566 length:1044 start_codon:yes stop_codon:yes gene_type:complete